jgi:ribosomal protein S18 acetylase RimI-like enzyme
MRANGSHRAEICKVMVPPSRQRQGIGRRIMDALEAEAVARQRSLIVLDTRDGDPSNRLYRAMGYVEAGRIPGYARSSAGTLDGTVIYYKSI